MGGDPLTFMLEWQPLAEHGNADAQYKMGTIYDHGVLRNNKTAVKWYTLAAEKGYAAAQVELGEMYVFGDGIVQDYVYGHMWVQLAAAQGNESAKAWKDNEIFKKMTPSQLETAKKLARECVRKKYKGC